MDSQTNGVETQTNPGTETQQNGSSVDTRLSELESKLKDAIKTRDEAKEKLRSIEENSMKENEKWKELAEKREQELTDLSVRVTEFESYKTKYEEIETATRNELLEQLPDEHKTIAESLNLNSLRDYVKLNGKTTVKTDSSPSGGLGFSTENKKWDDFTMSELEVLNEKNPQLYSKLRKEKFNN